jgi:hypothetical protein
MYMPFLLIALAFDCVGAVRVQPARITTLKTQDAQAKAEGWNGLIDVTKLIKNNKEFEKAGYDCCCDIRKSGDAGKADDRRGIDSEKRANYCAIAYTWGLSGFGKCGGVKVRNDTVKAHNYKSTGGRCLITRESIPTLATALENPEYCPQTEFEFNDMEAIILPAAVGKTSKAPCPDGSESTVKCLPGTATQGYWGAVECEGQPSYCPKILKSEDGAPLLAAAEVGDAVFVHCYPNVPSTENTKCTENGWIPQGGSTGWLVDGLPPMCTWEGMTYPE